jgi:hypothetical protein
MADSTPVANPTPSVRIVRQGSDTTAKVLRGARSQR